jgi:hypothetical protein
LEVYAASIPHATALGAALLLHHVWNKRSIPNDIIKSDLFSRPQTLFKKSVN